MRRKSSRTPPTFAGNATKKAVELARWLADTFNSRFLTLTSFRFGRRFRSGSGCAGRRAGRAFGAVCRHGFGEVRQHARRRQQREAAAFAQGRSARKNARAGFTASLRWFKSRVQSPKSTVHSPQSSIHNLFDGACEGRIIFEPRGKNGFGYDPLFVPVGFEQTFAELGEDVKNKLSHRAKALEKLKAHITKLPGGG